MICFEQEGLHFFRMRKKLPTAAEAVERGMKVWQPAAQEWPDPFNDGEVFMLTAWQHKWYENDEGEERDRALLDNQYKNREMLHQIQWMGRDVDERPMPSCYFRAFSFSTGDGFNPFGLSGWREDSFAVQFQPEESHKGREALLELAHSFGQLAIYSFRVEGGRHTHSKAHSKAYSKARRPIRKHGGPFFHSSHSTLLHSSHSRLAHASSRLFFHIRRADCSKPHTPFSPHAMPQKNTHTHTAFPMYHRLLFSPHQQAPPPRPMDRSHPHPPVPQLIR